MWRMISRTWEETRLKVRYDYRPLIISQIDVECLSVVIECYRVSTGNFTVVVLENVSNKSIRTTMCLKWTFWDILGQWDNSEDFLTSLEHSDSFSVTSDHFHPLSAHLRKYA